MQQTDIFDAIVSDESGSGHILCFLLGGIDALPSQINSVYVDRCIHSFVKDDDLKPSPDVVAFMKRCVLEKSVQFLEFVVSNNAVEDQGWLRRKSTILNEDLPSAPAMRLNQEMKLHRLHHKKRLSECERSVLQLQVCLMTSNPNCDMHLCQAWDISDGVVYNIRQKLRRQFKDPKPRPRAPSIMSPSIKSPDSKKARPSTTPLFSPGKILAFRPWSKKKFKPSVESPPSPIPFRSIEEADHSGRNAEHTCHIDNSLSPKRSHTISREYEHPIISREIAEQEQSRNQERFFLRGSTFLLVQPINTRTGVDIPAPPIVTPVEGEQSTVPLTALPRYLSVARPTVDTSSDVPAQAIVTPTEEDEVSEKTAISTGCIEVPANPFCAESDAVCWSPCSLHPYYISAKEDPQSAAKSSAAYEIRKKLSEAKAIADAFNLPLASTHSGNNKVSSFAEIPCMSGWKQWTDYARRVNWLESIIKKSVSGSQSDKEVAFEAVLLFSKKYPGVFERAGKELGYPAYTTSKLMDPYTAASMWNEANVTIKGQRVIRRTLFGFYGFHFTPPEEEINKLVSHIVYPTHGNVVVRKEKIHFWYRDVDEVVVSLLENEFEDIDFRRLDIIFGGDHGQSVFGAAVKIILWAHDWSIAATAVRKVGHIACTKDTYDILAATIAAPLNESLKRIKGKLLRLYLDGSRRIATFDEEDGTNKNYNDIPQEWNLRHSRRAANESENSATNAKAVDITEIVRDVRVYAIGDLAFVSMALGKINMEGHWCYACDLHPDDWSRLDHQEGTPWTLWRMKRTLEKIENQTMKDKPILRRGCVKESLFNVFEPCDYIPPCLHMSMGGFNDALKGLLLYIDLRHEKVPLQEFEARHAYWKAQSELNMATKDLADFECRLHDEIETKEIEMQILEEKKLLRNPSGSTQKFVFTQNQRRDFKIQIAFLKEAIKELKEGVEKRKKKIVTLNEIRDDFFKTYKKVRKNRRNVDSEIRQKVEQILIENGVDRAACHGGELTGVACQVLERRVVEIMDEIKILLKSAAETTSDLMSEIDEQLESYELHFLLLSRVFSLARTKKKVFKDDPVLKRQIILDLETAISLLNRSTQRLGLSMRTVKRHICDDHLVQSISVHDGIAEYQEDWLEQIHQSYKKFSGRAKIRDRSKKGDYEIKLEAISTNTKVKTAGKTSTERTRKVFKKDRLIIPGSVVQQAKKERRENAICRATTLFKEKPSLLHGHSIGVEAMQRLLKEMDPPT